MAIRHRIDRLEARAGRAAASAPCPGCGHAPGDGFELKIAGPEAVATLDDLPAAAEQPGDRCPRCGRQLVIRMHPPERARMNG